VGAGGRSGCFVYLRAVRTARLGIPVGGPSTSSEEHGCAWEGFPGERASILCSLNTFYNESPLCIKAATALGFGIIGEGAGRLPIGRYLNESTRGQTNERWVTLVAGQFWSSLGLAYQLSSILCPCAGRCDCRRPRTDGCRTHHGIGPIQFGRSGRRQAAMATLSSFAVSNDQAAVGTGVGFSWCSYSYNWPFYTHSEPRASQRNLRRTTRLALV